MRKCTAVKPHEESVSLFTYMNQESLNFAWQGNFARNWLQALTVVRPVKRSRSTYYDGPRLSSFMLWVWCGSSHKTPGCTLVCIIWCLEAGREVLSWVVWEAQPAQRYRRLGYFVDVVSVGRLSWECLYGGGSELKPFTPCNLLTYLPLLEDVFFFLSKGHYPFSFFERGIIHEICNTLLIIYYLPRERYFTTHFAIIPLTHCPLVTGTSYYLLNNTKIR